MNSRQKGNDKEQLAAEYLTKNGMRIAERNFRSRHGEIDIIGYDGGYLVFAEVKYRAGETTGNALEAVNIAKQKKICRTADYYRYIHHVGNDAQIRYDVIGIQGEKITWVKNAFPHIYGR